MEPHDPQSATGSLQRLRNQVGFHKAKIKKTESRTGARKESQSTEVGEAFGCIDYFSAFNKLQF